jgi:hypothetical protein
MAAADRRPVVIHVERRDPAIGGQGQRHGERRVAGEAAHLEDMARPHQLDQEGQELRLLGRAAHAAVRQAVGGFLQLREDRMLA